MTIAINSKQVVMPYQWTPTKKCRKITQRRCKLTLCYVNYVQGVYADRDAVTGIITQYLHQVSVPVSPSFQKKPTTISISFFLWSHQYKICIITKLHALHSSSPAFEHYQPCIGLFKYETNWTFGSTCVYCLYLVFSPSLRSSPHGALGWLRRD